MLQATWSLDILCQGNRLRTASVQLLFNLIVYSIYQWLPNSFCRNSIPGSTWVFNCPSCFICSTAFGTCHRPCINVNSALAWSQLIRKASAYWSYEGTSIKNPRKSQATSSYSNTLILDILWSVDVLPLAGKTANSSQLQLSWLKIVTLIVCITSNKPCSPVEAGFFQ